MSNTEGEGPPTDFLQQMHRFDDLPPKLRSAMIVGVEDWCAETCHTLIEQGKDPMWLAAYILKADHEKRNARRLET